MSNEYDDQTSPPFPFDLDNIKLPSLIDKAIVLIESPTLLVKLAWREG